MSKEVKLDYFLKLMSTIIDITELEYNYCNNEQITPEDVLRFMSLMQSKYNKSGLSNALSNRMNSFTTKLKESENVGLLRDFSENKLDMIITDFSELFKLLTTEIFGDIPISDFLVFENCDIDY